MKVRRKVKRPGVRFCWVCTRIFHGRHHRVIVDHDGYRHPVHVSCVGEFTTIPDAHLEALE